MSLQSASKLSWSLDWGGGVWHGLSAAGLSSWLTGLLIKKHSSSSAELLLLYSHSLYMLGVFNLAAAGALRIVLVQLKLSIKLHSETLSRAFTKQYICVFILISSLLWYRPPHKGRVESDKLGELNTHVVQAISFLVKQLKRICVLLVYCHNSLWS